MRKPLKITHISTPFSWRGGEQQIAYLYKGIEQINALNTLNGSIEQTIICPENSEMAKYCQKNSHNYKTYKKRGGTDPMAASFLKKHCSENEVDLIHAHDSHAHTMAVLAGVLFNNKTPIILSRRVDFPIKKTFKSRLKYNYKRIKKILCVSDFIAQMVKEGISNSDIEIHTVHSGVEINLAPNEEKHILRTEYNIDENSLIIANTSAIANQKDYFTFLDSAKLIKEKMDSVHFFIIGSGPMEKEIKQYCNQLGLSDTVTFTGFRNDLKDLWNDIDIMLFPSKTEGLGTSILDAFANDVPVVATNAGGIPEIVIHEQTGLLAPIKNAPVLCELVLRLAQNESLKKQLISGAKEHLKHFDRLKTANQTVLHYYDVFK